MRKIIATASIFALAACGLTGTDNERENEETSAAADQMSLDDNAADSMRSSDPDTGATYYRHWLATLERMVAEKDLTTAETLRQYCHAWDRAAHRTPHGTPIELRPEDFSRSV